MLILHQPDKSKIAIIGFLTVEIDGYLEAIQEKKVSGRGTACRAFPAGRCAFSMMPLVFKLL